MGVCATCTAAIQQLRPHDRRENTLRRITVALLGYRDTTVLECWICLKFSQWLQTQDRDAFASWRTQELQVEYFEFIHLKALPQEEPHENIIMPFVMGIRPPKHERDNSCFVELNFISPNGKHWTIFYVLRSYLSRKGQTNGLLTQTWQI